MGKQITFYQEHMISVYLKQKTIKNFVLSAKISAFLGLSVKFFSVTVNKKVLGSSRDEISYSFEKF